MSTLIPVKKVALIQVKYISPTDHSGSRVQLKSFDVAHRNGGKPKSITVGYDHQFNGSCDQAEALLVKNGFKLLGLNTSSKEYDVFFAEWDWDTMATFFKVKVQS